MKNFRFSCHSKSTLDTPKMSQKRNSRATKFQPLHEVLYELRVISKNSRTNDVTSVKCQFCIYFDRESIFEERKRQQTNIVKHWKGPPFRIEHYKGHHERQHGEIWVKYRSLSLEEKRVFFINQPKNKGTLHHHFNNDKIVPIRFTIDLNIIDVIIGDMLFHLSDHGEVTQANALKLFKFKKAETGTSYYEITHFVSLSNLLF